MKKKKKRRRRRKKMMGDEVPHFYIYKLPIVRLSGCYVKGDLSYTDNLLL